MTPLQGALAAASRGWSVFPLAAGSKVPLLPADWRVLSSTAPEVINRWAIDCPACNFAIDTGKSGLVVVDLDVSPAGVAEWPPAWPPPAGTRCHRTPSGGRHWVFSGLARSRTRVEPGVDIRAAGGYVVCPGSVNGRGVWDIVIDVPPGPCPPELLAVIGIPAAAVESDRGDACTPDLPDAVAEAEKYLAHAAASVEGEGGNHTAYRTACAVRDLGISREKCSALLAGGWNGRCQPPWSVADLETIAAHAYRYAQAPDVGANAPAVCDLRAVQVFSALASVPIPASALAAVTPPRREWMIEGLLPLGSPALVTGAPGVGKSSVALQIALAMAGGVLWRMKTRKDTAVLYVGCEDSRDELHRRVHALGGAPGNVMIWPRNGYPNALGIWDDRRGMTVGPFWGPLADALDRMPSGVPRLVILDTLVDVWVGNENDRVAVNAMVKEVLGRLRDRYGATVLALAHPPKNTGAEYSGSTAWEGCFRTRLYLAYQDERHPAAGSDIRTLTTSKANYGPVGARLVLRRQSTGKYSEVPMLRLESQFDDVVFETIREAALAGEPMSTGRGMRDRCITEPGRVKLGDIEVQSGDVVSAVRRLMVARRIFRRYSRPAGLFPTGWQEQYQGDLRPEDLVP